MKDNLNSKIIADGIVKAVFKIVGLCALIWGIYSISNLIFYILLSIVFALVFAPIVSILKTKLKFHNTLASITTMLFMMSFLIAFLAMVIPLLASQGEHLSVIDITGLKSELDIFFQKMLPSLFREKIMTFLDVYFQNILSVLNGSLFPLIETILSSVGSIGVGFFIVIFITFFFIKDHLLIKKIVSVLSPENKVKEVLYVYDKIIFLLSRYFLGLFFQISILIFIYFMTLLIVGVDNAFSIAFLCAVFNLIPYVGPLVGTTLMAFLTFSTNIDLGIVAVLPKIMWVTIGVAIAQLTDSFFTQPIVYSGSVKSHPLEVFVVILATGMLFGVFGMMIAIPAYTTIKVILKTLMPDNKIVKALTSKI